MILQVIRPAISLTHSTQAHVRQGPSPGLACVGRLGKKRGRSLRGEL